MNKILWRKVKIKHFEHYHISNDGVILNTKTDKLTIGHKIDRPNGKFMGYQVQLFNKNYSRSIMVHLLVLMHFKKKEINKNYGLHIDYDKANNQIKNLKWASFGELLSYGMRMSHIKKGKIRGVYKYKNRGYIYWRAALTLGKGKTKTLGYFNTKKEAMFVYKDAYINRYGINPYLKDNI